MLKHTYTNVREVGFEGERNDCTVRALTTVTAVPYRDAHAYLKKLGRQDGHGMYFENHLQMWASSKTIIFGFRVSKVEIPAAKATQQLRKVRGAYMQRWVVKWHRPTLAQMMHKCRDGRYMVVIRGHVFAVMNGTIVDTGTNGARHGVTSIWKWEESSKVEKREQETI